MLYPMTFKPILKKIIWGGSDICPFKGITPVQEGIGGTFTCRGQLFCCR